LFAVYKHFTLLQLASVSALTNVEKIQCHVFRNYNLTPSVQSHYLGSCSFKLWEAIRASSAAPGYYEEFKLGNMVHQVGAPQKCILGQLVG